MKIPFSRVLEDLFGEPLKQKGDEPATLGVVAINALMFNFPDEKLTGDEKLDRYLLAAKIRKEADAAELTAIEVAQVRELVGKAYGPQVVGPAFEILDSNAPPKPNGHDLSSRRRRGNMGARDQGAAERADQ